MTKRTLGLAVALGLLCAWAMPCAAARHATNSTSFALSEDATPGVKAAEALSTITGVAISPLLGVSAVGAWKYWRTAPEKRASLPWFAQPWFWISGLVLVGLVFLKDVTGTAMPAPFKKPLDVAEVFENKISALVAAGAFVPIIASIFTAVDDSGQTALAASMGLAAIDPVSLLNVVVVPLAVAAFLVVWLVSHVINVLVLLSPFGVIDAGLKLARTFLLGTVAVSSLVNPYFGAAVSLVIIVVAWFLAGWSMRLTMFGSVFAWDLLTMRCKRFVPSAEKGLRAFTARRMEKVPVRTCGWMRRDAQGRLVLEYRRWFILPRRVVLPEGDFSVGRGLVYPEVLHLKDGVAKSVLALSPRCVSHEAEIAKHYDMAGVQDTGMIRGVKAFWNWMKGLFGSGRKAVPVPA